MLSSFVVPVYDESSILAQHNKKKNVKNVILSSVKPPCEDEHIMLDYSKDTLGTEHLHSSLSVFPRAFRVGSRRWSPEGSLTSLHKAKVTHKLILARI